MKLHTRAQNSAGERVRIALHLKGIAFDYLPIPDLQADVFRLISPQGLMPILDVDGVRLSQSLAIIEYLDDRFPHPPVLPDQPIAKAQSRAFAMAICAELHAVTVHRVRARLMQKHGIDQDGVDDWYEHWTAKTFGALEQVLRARQTTHQFCFAVHPTIADIALVPQVANAKRFGCDMNNYPLLMTINDRCQKLDAFIKARPDNQIDFVAKLS